jgi:hypothetical protein
VRRELFPKQVEGGRLPAKAVPILRKHYVYAANCYKIAHLVHTRTLKRSTAVSGIGDLFYHVEVFRGAKLSESVELLGDAVAVFFGLLLGRYVGEKSGPLLMMPVSAYGHASFLS